MWIQLWMCSGKLKGDFICENSLPNPPHERAQSRACTSSGVGAQHHVDVPLVNTAKLLLRADVTDLIVWAWWREHHVNNGKHQQLKAEKWKRGGYETGIIIKANLRIAFCTPGKTVSQHRYCVNVYREHRVIFAFEHLICEQNCRWAFPLT